MSDRNRAAGVRMCAAFAFSAVLFFSASVSASNDGGSRFLTPVQDPAFVTSTLERERPLTPAPLPVTGITVPHHLLAADLIARGVLAASGGSYDRVLIISPDHFRTLDTPFGITTGDLQTSMGVLVADRTFAQKILAASEMFSDIGTVPHEHGIHAVTPFIRAVFPNIRIVAITTATSSTPMQWRAAAALLGGLVDSKTLIVQSTDYSHFLPVGTSALRDQETLAAVASGDPNGVLALTQPDHMDSRASQFIQMTLQRTVYHATPIIIANRNAHEYIPAPGPTTSYVVTVYTPELEHGWRLHYPDQTMLYFGGDTFIGRGWTDPAVHPATADWLVQKIKNYTGGNPLVINLEGVVLEQRPAGANVTQHLMIAPIALPLLQKLGLAAANTANNHAYDFGAVGLAETVRLLEANGIRVLQHGVLAKFGAVDILPLTFKRSYFYDHEVVHLQSQLRSICELRSTSPLVVLPHWGEEYSDSPGPFENSALDTLAECGVSAVIGAHSHRASSNIELRGGGSLQSVFSIGNLVFDETAPRVSGSVVEMRVFRQGTIALRIIPIPNFFEMLRDGHL